MNLLAQRSAIDTLHGDEVHTVALADFMDGGDVRMIERRRGFCFLSEAPHAVLIRGEVSRQNLERNLAVKFGVLCEIDLTHATRTELGNDAIVRQAGAGGQLCHSCSFTSQRQIAQDRACWPPWALTAG